MLANRILDAVGAPIREAKSDPAPAGDDREPIIAANDAEAYREMAGGKLKWAINTYEDDGSLSWHDISQALYALRHAFVILSAPAPESKGMDLEAEQDAWVKWYDEEAETHLGIRAISWKTWIACARRLRAGAEGGK